ncbi:hypothetical protein [Phenylobacterium immobile]|uniref:hypothetical protein n=1 Tax=Phenylobacterium immobile TaxID=21 RepID=UPI000B81FE6C|nr:hypothetical protein [Phenylobacterium immobile]
MLIQTPSTSDLIGRALLAATLALSEEPDAARDSSGARARCGAQACASALADRLAWPVSRAARLLGVQAEQIWDARRDPPPGFRAAEREAAAAIALALGPLARPTPDDHEDEDAIEPPADVVRLRALSPAILRWSKTYASMGASIEDLAELFSVAPEALAAAVEPGQ